MLELAAALLLLQDSPPRSHYLWMLRHQRADGGWSAGPVGCECAKDQPPGKAGAVDPALEKKVKPLLEALKSAEASEREKAIADLEALGPGVDTLLRDALRTADADHRDPILAALRRVVQARTPGDIESTALALVSILGTSHSHLSKEVYEGRVMGEAVKAGFTWLMKRQKASGLIGEEAAEGVGPGHVLATLALCESYGFTGTKLFRQPALNALDYLAGRQRKSGAFGPGRDDPETSLWCVLLFHSAKLHDFEIPKEVVKSLGKWLAANSGKGRDLEAAAHVLFKALLEGDASGLDDIGERLVAVPTAAADPVLRAACSLALLHQEGVSGDRWLRWRKGALKDWTQLEKDGCERGSPVLAGRPARLAGLNLIALEGVYVYSRVLGSPKTKDWPPSRPR